MTDRNKKPTLIFVYNAGSGIFNSLTDAAHKILSPQTYKCSLCALTHSNFGMKREWKSYLKDLENPAEFLHADEFEKKYGNSDTLFPTIFKKDNAGLTLFIDSETINRCSSIEELKQLLKS